MRKVGNDLLISGLVITGVGAIVIWFEPVSATTLLGVGNLLTIASIPVSASAGARKKAIKNGFAREHFGIGGYTYQPTLKLNCTGNGFGISLNF
ncbi:MAG: hypothetical protein FWH36_08990 [Lentimicrobiaceae bacterium]|nr:hypothetical protein [Lentimicrobiaceae bacterium]